MQLVESNKGKCSGVPCAAEESWVFPDRCCPFQSWSSRFPGTQTANRPSDKSDPTSSKSTGSGAKEHWQPPPLIASHSRCPFLFWGMSNTRLTYICFPSDAADRYLNRQVRVQWWNYQRLYTLLPGAINNFATVTKTQNCLGDALFCSSAISEWFPNNFQEVSWFGSIYGETRNALAKRFPLNPREYSFIPHLLLKTICFIYFKFFSQQILHLCV